MNKKIIGVLVIAAVIAGALFLMYSHKEKEVPKPWDWGLADPPLANNLTWSQDGKVQITNATLPNAPSFYGEMERELLNLGYSMLMGNWSNTSCQWSVWNSMTRNRTYYIAYSGTHFIGIRGSYFDVMNAADKHWICQNPANSSIMVTPSPESAAREISLRIGDIMMQQNITVGPLNWTGPMPDWYLGKFSFQIHFGKGVDVLVLVYTSQEQAEYARYLLEKEDSSLKILRDYGGQYYSLIVFKGDEHDVNAVIKIIQSSQQSSKP